MEQQPIDTTLAIAQAQVVDKIRAVKMCVLDPRMNWRIIVVYHIIWP